MHKAMLGFTVALVIIGVVTITQAQVSGFSIHKASITLAQAYANPASPQAMKKTTTVERTISPAPPDETEKHFRNARESFLKKDARAAAAEIRKGAVLLELEAGHAKGKVKEALAASSHELQKLAQGVENGTVTSTQDLRRAFARADRALAEQHYQSAAESWSKKEIKKAGRELKAAANHVELAVAWADHRLDSTTAAVIKDARAVAAKLSEKAGWTKDEVVKGMHGVGNEIEKLGKQIEPAKT
ncbi:MAG: hypothetical protein ACM3TN_13435 [Alphaproteobacteria bacterium]